MELSRAYRRRWWSQFQRTRWWLGQPDAIAGIEPADYAFYMQRGGRTVRVVVAVSRFGNKYLKAEADDEQPDNLLSLPECPQ